MPFKQYPVAIVNFFVFKKEPTFSNVIVKQVIFLNRSMYLDQNSNE